MFKLHLDSQQSTMDWRIEGNALVSQNGVFMPFSHPMVEVQAVLVPPGRLGIFIFERPYCEPEPEIQLEYAASHDELEALKYAAQSWPLHWYFLDISASGVFIDASPLASVPVFFTDNGQRLDVSWDPLTLYPLIAPILDEHRAMLYLSHFDQPYGTDTLLAQLKKLCAGHGVRWQQHSGWSIYRQPDCKRTYPKVLKKDADPCRSFSQLLSSILQRLLPDTSVGVASGFSGGLDSSIVTAVAAKNGCNVRTYGLLMPDEGRDLQEKRRNTLITQFGLQDRTIDTAVNPPQGSYGHRPHQPMVPWEELHYAYFDAMYKQAARDNCRVFLSGFGGDELLSEYWDEMENKTQAISELTQPKGLPDFFSERIDANQRVRLSQLLATPSIYAQSSVVVATSDVAAQCLRNGLWPVHLLAMPEVVQYCHSLPHEWRAKRRLMRKVLSDWGVSHLIAYPQNTESFTTLSCQALMHCQQAQTLFPLVKLEALGWVKTCKVAQAYHRWLKGEGKGKLDIHFIAMVVLESTLDSVTAAGQSMGECWASSHNTWFAPSPNDHVLK